MRRVSGAHRGGRGLVVSAVLARGALRLVRRAAINRVRGRPRPFAALAGETLAETLERLGPTFIKVGQILGTRQDLLPPQATKPLQRLYDDLPPVPDGTLEALFEAELGVSPHVAFASWDPVPVASASVATVYRAWLTDGTAVAVKVLRPGIAAVVAADLALMRRGAKIGERLPGMSLIPMRPMVEELAASLERQLDLRREAAANHRLRQALTYETAISIPPLVEQYCSSSILTMHYMPPSDHAATADGRSLLAVLGALYRMIFVEGFIHCDLHPGNLRLYAGGRAALLDFGFMAEMPSADRCAFAQFFYAMAAGDGEACAQLSLQTAAACREGLDRAAFTAEMVAIVDQVAGRTAREFSVAGFVTRLFDLMRRHGVRGTTAFTMAIVALLVLEGLAKDADVDLDFQTEARPYLFRASLAAAPRERVTSERVDALVREKLMDVSVEAAVYNGQRAV
jgi:ubiquinone biosynthesis protein